MGGSSGGGNTKTTQTSSPWSGQTPYLKYGLDEATRLYQQAGPQYYPGSKVAGFSPEQNQAFSMGTQRALNGSQDINNAKGFTNGVLSGQYGTPSGVSNFANASMNGGYGQSQDTAKYVHEVLQGKYLNSDPYKDQVFKNIQQQVLPSVNSQFMGSGRYGSDSHAGTMTTNLTNAYAPYASQQYQQGLDRMNWAAGMSDQMNNNQYARMMGGAQMANDLYNQGMGYRQWAAGMAPTWAANDYQDLAALEAIGQQKQGLAQNELNDAAARWDYYQRLPYDKLGQYLNNIGGNYGGTVVGKQPSNEPSTWQQIAGGGLGLLGLFA